MASSNFATSWTPILLEAAEKVRTCVRRALLKRPTLSVSDLKSLLDSEAQAAIEGALLNLGASAKLISEEGDSTIRDGEMYVVVDPVDGTTNLAKGIPLAVTSLAVSDTPSLSGAFSGLVMNLYSGEIYRAERNHGAWRAGMPILCSGPKPIENALISIDISKGALLEPVQKILARAGHLRQLGCSAISLCLLASGVLDAHIDLRGLLRATDVAAGLLILKEAGGAYCINGVIDGDLKLSRQSKLDLVAASNHEMLDKVLSLVKT
jgi:myo-inositol-1(or 4)-monophosphatase